MSNFIHELKINSAGKVAASVQGSNDIALAFDPGAPVRNLIINGNMDFWQRTTSSSTNGAFTADRFQSVFSGYTATFSQSTDVPTAAQSGFQSRYSYLVTNGTGAAPTSGQYQSFYYKVEGQDYQIIHGGKKVRFQFWVKSSVTGTYVISLLNSATNRNYTTTYTINTASAWQKINLDFSTDSAGTWNFDNTIGLYLIWALTAGTSLQTSTLNVWQPGSAQQGYSGQTQWGATTSATFQLAQVMLTPGDYSTNPNISLPFQRTGNSIGHELQLCQRYFSCSGGAAVSTSTIDYLVTTYNGGNIQGTPIYFPIIMRAAPTVVVTDGTNTGKIFAAFANDTTAGSSNQSPPSGLDIRTNSICYSSGGFTFPNNATIADSLSHAVRIGVFGHTWTADAEL